MKKVIRLSSPMTFFYANKKFDEAELNFENIDLAAKSAVMSIFFSLWYQFL